MSDVSSSRNDSITDYSPLSQACIKALTDRMDDKRKFAANEIEKMTVEFSMSNNLIMVNRLIIVLGRRFCLSHQQNTRKGGLLGLAAVMVGFKNGSVTAPPAEMVEEVVRPILTCLLDSDSRVRQYACEALYNVTKVSRGNILPLFELIFDSLTRMVADNDINVRIVAEAMDRLLRDIVVESSELPIDRFVVKLEEYIYSRNKYTRMFIVSWIRLLDSKFDIIKYLPHLLDGIFNCLYECTEEIRASILALLSEFLNKIITRPTDGLDLSSLVNTLLKHTRNDREGTVQYTAIAWIRQLILLLEGQDLLAFTPGILEAILPCLAYQRQDETTSSITDERPMSSSASQFSPSAAEQTNISEIATLVNSSIRDLVINVINDRQTTGNLEPIHYDLDAILEVLVKEIQIQDHPLIKLSILDWVRVLREAESQFIPAKINQPQILQPLLETISAPSDAVVKSALRVMTAIFRDDVNTDFSNNKQATQQSGSDPSGQVTEEASVTTDEETTAPAAAGDRRKGTTTRQVSQQPKSPVAVSKRVAIAPSDTTPTPQPGIQRFIQALYKTFRENQPMFNKRGTFVLLNLCTMVKAERVYWSFAEIIKAEKSDLKFAYHLVQKLNQILLTTQPLFVLRSRLSNDDDPELSNLFQTLYLAWCHSPIATVTLCLLANHYRLASEIVTALTRADINVELLIQIDWVVQLIESPVFAPLRMRLLDANNNQHLMQALYGLLMILPQSDAYKRLSHRLDQVYKFMVAQASYKAAGSQKPGSLSASASSVAIKDLKKASSPSAAPATTAAALAQASIESLMKHYHVIQSLRTKYTPTGGTTSTGSSRNVDADGV